MRPVFALGLFCALTFPAAAQEPTHRDRIARGAVAAAVTLPVGVPLTLEPRDLEVLDDGRAVDVSAVVSGVRPALAILVDVALGESAKVGSLLDLVDETLGQSPVEASPIRHVNQYNFRQPYRYGESIERYMRAPEDRNAYSGGNWRFQERPMGNAADWALASLQFRRSRRVLVVVTDGIRRPHVIPYSPEPGSTRQVSFGDFRDRVRQEFATVFVVGVDGAEVSDDLRKIAAESGGDVRGVQPGEDLRAALSGLAQQVADQRIAYFVPTKSDGKVHRLQVRLKAGAFLLQAPSLYLAPRSQR